MAIRSSTPSENQPSASASTLRSLSIYRRAFARYLPEENGYLACDLVAFQRSNNKPGGGLEVFQDFSPFQPEGPPRFSTRPAT